MASSKKRMEAIRDIMWPPEDPGAPWDADTMDDLARVMGDKPTGQSLADKHLREIHEVMYPDDDPDAPWDADTTQNVAWVAEDYLRAVQENGNPGGTKKMAEKKTSAIEFVADRKLALAKAKYAASGSLDTDFTERQLRRAYSKVHAKNRHRNPKARDVAEALVTKKVLKEELGGKLPTATQWKYLSSSVAFALDVLDLPHNPGRKKMAKKKASKKKASKKKASKPPKRGKVAKKRCARRGKISSASRKRLPDNAFALTELRKYPLYKMGGDGKLVPSATHATAAKGRAKTALDAGKLSRKAYQSIVRKANKVLGRCSTTARKEKARARGSAYQRGKRRALSVAQQRKILNAAVAEAAGG